MLVFTGDINLTDNAFDVGYGVGSFVSGNGNPFSNIVKRPGDCWIGNFEGVCSDTSELTSYKKDCFRVNEMGISNLGLIDYYGVANNHIMEHGPTAYENTMNAIRQNGAEVFGGLSKKSIRLQHDGKSIGILGFSLRNDGHPFVPQYWNFPEIYEIVDEFDKIKDCDYKVAYIHWGVEFVSYPSMAQKQFAHCLVDVGFDLIIGMHPHVLQGYEIYKDKYIFYSLGNFVFNMVWEDTRYGSIVKLDVKTGSVTYDYIHIDDNYSPKIIGEEHVPERLRFCRLNTMLDKMDNVETYCNIANKYLNRYRKHNNIAILKNLYRSNPLFIYFMMKDFFARRLLGK